MQKRKILNDAELLDRLIHMGLLSDGNTINEEGMSAFAGIFFGLFVWDAKCAYPPGANQLLPVYEMLIKDEKASDYCDAYLMLSVQYDQMGKTLPDPVWWLMCSDVAVRGFMQRFIERFGEYIAGCVPAAAE